MARGRRRKCKCCRKLFRPDPRNSATSATARGPCAEQPAKPSAKPSGSPGPRTATTFEGPCISPAARPGGRAIPAIGVSARAGAVRIKTSQWHNLLVPLAKRAFPCTHRYKIS